MAFLRFPVIHEIKCKLLSVASRITDLLSCPFDPFHLLQPLTCTSLSSSHIELIRTPLKCQVFKIVEKFIYKLSTHLYLLVHNNTVQIIHENFWNIKYLIILLNYLSYGQIV